MKSEWRPSARMVRLDITVTAALMHEPSVASVTWAFRKKAGRRIRTLSAAAGSQAQGFPGRHLVSEACLPLGRCTWRGLGHFRVYLWFRGSPRSSPLIAPLQPPDVAHWQNPTDSLPGPAGRWAYAHLRS